MEYNLEARTYTFSLAVIDFCRQLTRDVISQPIISQLVRSTTSIGANYVEATAAASKKDFRNKICLCKKEAHETRYWLKIMGHSLPRCTTQAHKLEKECDELIRIFQKITNSLKEDLRGEN